MKEKDCSLTLRGDDEERSIGWECSFLEIRLSFD
jgi:hypothetical protein